MRTAVVGAGAWGRNLVRNLHDLDALGAVADISPAIRREISDQYPGLMICEDLGPLLESEIPAVLIATPAQTHYEAARACLEAGKDVFIEKPMTLSSEAASQLVRLAAEKGRLLMVGHLLLYQPALWWLQAQIASGRIGQLCSIHQSRLGLGKARSCENVLWSLGVHDVAVAMHLTGCEPETVDALGQCVLQPGIEDEVHLHMRFPGNIRTHLHCSWLWPERQRRTVVVGSEAMLVYDEFDQTVTLHRKRIDADLKNVDEGSEIAYRGTGEPLKVELEHFMDCVETRARPVSDGENGLAVVRVLETASGRLRE